MTKKYEIYLPKSKEQLIDFLQRITKKSTVKHYIIRIFEEYILVEELLEILKKYKPEIEKFRKNKSIVLWVEEYYDEIPEFIPMAPTEEESLDIIEFEEIERDLGF